MFTVPQIAAKELASFLASDMKDRFGGSNGQLAELVPFAVQLALEFIGNSDALYHNVEHTMLVTLAGQQIINGRALLVPTTASDYANLVVACLTHDIGFVRGIIKGDDEDGCVVDASGRKIALAPGSSDAALTPYHIERSKLFVQERIGSMDELAGERIVRAIEYTRFPYPATEDEQVDELSSMLRAADLIGQIGDPHYLRKLNALYYEFEEIGMNRQLGYNSPADLVSNYPQFYWKTFSPHLQPAIRYLSVTSKGREWIANLYSNIYRAEHPRALARLQ
ncbi:MAG TPA: metal-dependent phosphohydrolase [Xanthobacteraceae bacterium]|jgi:hypothetical protein